MGRKVPFQRGSIDYGILSSRDFVDKGVTMVGENGGAEMERNSFTQPWTSRAWLRRLKGTYQSHA